MPANKEASAEESGPFRKLLIVAFHYPPDMSSSGVLRTLKFSRYLPEFGWLPHVLTVKEKHYESRDSGLLRQIPSIVKVYRTSAINTKSALSIGGKYLKITAIPDRFIGWLPFAVASGLRVIRKEGINTLYSTSPLATSHLIAGTLKYLTGLPWLADFRDPWTEPEMATNLRAPLFRLESSLESWVVGKADRLCFTTSGLRDEFLRRHPATQPEKAIVIPNGYDEEDFQTLLGQPDAYPPMLITHTGLVDQEYRSPRPLFEAIAQLKRMKEIAAGQIRVDFLGGGGYVESQAFHQLIADFDLQQEVTISGRVGYAESLAKQSRSHVLLILQCTDDTRHLIPAKAFEYLRVGRPILALARPSATSELFDQVGGACVIDPRDLSGLMVALNQLLNSATEGSLISNVNLASLRNYARRKLSERLSSALNELMVAANRRSERSTSGSSKVSGNLG